MDSKKITAKRVKGARHGGWRKSLKKVQLGKLEALDGVNVYRRRSLRHTRAAPAQPPLADQQAVF